MKPRLLLRADGDARIGLGHISRLVALAEIAGSDWHRVFVLREPTPGVRTLLQDSIQEIVALPSLSPLEEAEWLATNLLQPTDVLALDGYGFDFAYQRRVRQAVGALLFIDDLHAFPQAADVVLNPAGGVPISAYELRQPGARLLIGPMWAPMRTPFREAAKSVPEPAAVGQVLLCLGGADPTNSTQRLAIDLLNTPGVGHLHVAVGAAYGQLDSLVLWAKDQDSDQVTVHHALSALDFCRLLQKCGTAVTSASTVSYEYASAGGGLLFILTTADNQRGIYDFLLREGLARPYHALANVLSAPDVTHIVALLRAAQQKHFDGQTPERLRRLLAGLRAQAGLQVRPAGWPDSDQLLTWANDPVVRQFSYHSAPIQVAGHEAWLRARLAEPNHLLLIAELANQAVGTIRYALDETGTATLSYLLGPEFRGLGLASVLLLKGSNAALSYFGNRLTRMVGHVQNHNEASQRAFRRAGFAALTDADTPHDSVSFEQKLSTSLGS